MKIYFETNAGEHWDFYGIEQHDDTEQVSALAQQLINPDPDPQALRHAAPTAQTIEAADCELIGVLDEGALIELQLSEPVAVLAKQARGRKWGQERIRGLIC